MNEIPVFRLILLLLVLVAMGVGFTCVYTVSETEQAVELIRTIAKDNNKPSGAHAIMSHPLPVTFELCNNAATPYTAVATSTSNKLSAYPKPRAKWTVGRVSLKTNIQCSQ